MATFSWEEVAKHDKDGDAWIVIDGDVYDVSKFAKFHPGGRQMLLRSAGKDASDEAKQYHAPHVLRKWLPRFKIGTIVDYSAPTPLLPPPLPNSFGNLIPYADPIWYQRFHSPYYTPSHEKFRSFVRNFVETEIEPTIEEWKGKDVPPADIYRKMGENGLLGAMCGAPYPFDLVPPAARENIPADFDYFHELIVFDEFARLGYSAVVAALTNGPAIAASALIRFASDEMKNTVVKECLSGKAYIALAISEPNAGSDVASLITTASRQNESSSRQNESDFFIVNGNKKWITNGTYAKYFVTGVVTGEGGGHGGLSFLLIERDTPGFSIRKVNIRDSDISGTAYLDFDNCRVPAKNLIGPLNQGFRLIMHNFNHERMYISVVCCRMARICLEESIKYALRRKTFGKSLHEHQSIRMAVAEMARNVEQLQTWIEFVVFQMIKMGHSEANQKIGDVMCLVKSQASRVYHLCAHQASNICGGNSLHAGGVTTRVEPAEAQVRGYHIPAGAANVMDDFAARTAFKMAKLMAKL